MNAPERFTLRMTRFIRAPRDKVFAAFTTEAGLASWMGPRGMRVNAAQVHAEVGGAWQVEMQSRDGSLFVVGGHFTALNRPASLAYTWQWKGEHNPMPGVETLVEIALHEKDGGTEMQMTHSGFPAAAARDGHNQGWSSTFNRLSDALDPQGSAGTVVLLGDVRSTYTRTARMALAEKGVAYTMHTCRAHTPDILAVHPFGKIPGLRDGDIAIWETEAIVNYIDECFGDAPTLRPGSIIERTRCLQWISSINNYCYDTMVRRFVLQFIFPKGEGGKPDIAVIDKALAEMPAQLKALDTAYGTRDFLAGSSLSSADLFLAPILAYVKMMPQGGALLAQYANVMRAHDTMASRPSFTNTQPG